MNEPIRRNILKHVKDDNGIENEQWKMLLANNESSMPLRTQQLHITKMETRRRFSTSILDSLSKNPKISLECDTQNNKLSNRRACKRIVFKHGDCNIVQENVAKRRRKYLQDIFTTLVDAQWRWTLLVFSMNFLLSWLGFAIVWWLIAVAHGDLSVNHMNNQTWIPCVTNIYGFTSCFLFSVETQHTIGFGGRTTTEECPEAIFVMCLQSLAGVMIQAFMVGIVFAKLSRPKKRTQTLLFSRNAVICHRDGIPCLMFRVGDMRRSHIIEAHVRSQLIKHKITTEGENLPFYQMELKVGCDGEVDKIFFIWPTTIVHKIDDTSPLYSMSATDILKESFEIVVILEGVIESTGMTTQARSSYLPSEILWGHRFQPLISYKKETGEYEVDYALFNNTMEVVTPLCSAKQLDQHRAVYKYEQCLDSYLPATHRQSESLCSLDSFLLDSEINIIQNPISSGLAQHNVSISLQNEESMEHSTLNI